MKKSLLRYVVCPSCKGSLSLKDAVRRDSEIVGGMLACSACGREYPIVRGVPRLLLKIPKELERTKKSFGYQWRKYKRIYTRLEEETFLKKTGFSKGQLRNKLVLDVGCGYGRYSYIAGKLGGNVIGIDLSDAVDSAYENTKGMGNVNIIQANLFNLPLKEGIFDVIFSIGVLHHTPSPSRSFDAVVPYAKRGGIVSIWVYRTRGKAMDFLDKSIRTVTNKLPHPLFFSLCWVARPLGAVVLWATPHFRHIRTVFFFVSHKPYADMRQADTFDWWTPEYVHFHTDEELHGWFSKNKLKNITHREPVVVGKDRIADVGVSGRK